MQIISSSVKVAEWQAFRKELLPWLIVCSFLSSVYFNYGYFPFGMRAILVLIVSVPAH